MIGKAVPGGRLIRGALFSVDVRFRIERPVQTGVVTDEENREHRRKLNLQWH